MVVLTSNVTLEIFSKILNSFNLNPIFLNEVVNRQEFDKFLEMDEDTILFNLQMQKQFQLKDSSLLKILHLKNHKILLILTDNKKKYDNYEVL